MATTGDTDNNKQPDLKAGGKSRVDKWLWSVRVFKTRTQASDACRNGKVKIDDKAIKPSRMITVGEELQVRKGLVNYRFKVIQPLDKRVAAKLVPDYMEDLTSPEELEKLRQNKMLPSAFRDRGTGRPTKKERRNIDKWQEKHGGNW